MAQLEREWFTLHTAAATARVEADAARRADQAEIAEAAMRRLGVLEQQKFKVIHDIEALEESLLD